MATIIAFDKLKRRRARKGPPALLAIKKPSPLHLVFLLVLALIGLVVILIETKGGISIHLDGITYISTARSLKTGMGLIYLNFFGQFSPLSWFPPMIPFLLYILPGDPLISFRILNSIIFALIIFTSGLFVFKRTGNKLSAIFIQLFVFFSPTIHGISVGAWSEPLFILLTFFCIWQVLIFLENGNKLNFFLTCLILVFSVMTRYAGLFLGIFVPVVILIFLKSNWRNKAFYAVAAAFCVFFTFVLWNVYLKFILHTEIARTFHFNLIELSKLKKGISTVVTWFLPLGFFKSRSIRIIVFLAVLSFLFFLLARYIRNTPNLNNAGPPRGFFIAKKFIGERNQKEIIIFLFFIFSYLSFLFVSITLFGPKTTLDNRTLSIVYIPTFMGLVMILNRGKKLRFGLWFALAYLLILTIITGSLSIRSRLIRGNADDVPKWQKNNIVNYLEKNNRGRAALPAVNSKGVASWRVPCRSSPDQPAPENSENSQR
jgi:hypothetical protein